MEFLFRRMPQNPEAYADQLDRLEYHDLLLDQGREEVAAILAEGESLHSAGVLPVECLIAAWRFAAMPRPLKFPDGSPDLEGHCDGLWRATARNAQSQQSLDAFVWGLRRTRAVMAEWGCQTDVATRVRPVCEFGTVVPVTWDGQNTVVTVMRHNGVVMPEVAPVDPSQPASVVVQMDWPDEDRFGSIYYDPAYGWIVIDSQGRMEAVEPAGIHGWASAYFRA